MDDALCVGCIQPIGDPADDASELGQFKFSLDSQALLKRATDHVTHDKVWLASMPAEIKDRDN